jgi:hypothetical protein
MHELTTLKETIKLNASHNVSSYKINKLTVHPWQWQQLKVSRKLANLHHWLEQK